MSSTSVAKSGDTMTLAPLSAAERKLGWVEFACSDHGALVAGPATLDVRCACGQKARPTRDGAPVAKATLSRLRRAENGST